jgi:hypothetical protein
MVGRPEEAIILLKQSADRNLRQAEDVLEQYLLWAVKRASATTAKSVAVARESKRQDGLSADRRSPCMLP